MPTRIRATIATLAAAGTLGVAAVATTTGTAAAHERWARASLASADGSGIGTVAFRDDASDRTEVIVRLRRATGVEAFHGLHIHANDVTANGDGCIADAAQPPSTWFVSADGHWKHDPTELHGRVTSSTTTNRRNRSSVFDSRRPARCHSPSGRPCSSRPTNTGLR